MFFSISSESHWQSLHFYLKNFNTIVLTFDLFSFVAQYFYKWICDYTSSGDEYKQHTQCISEDQKYGGKGYQALQNANKGEAKQEQWLQVV